MGAELADGDTEWGLAAEYAAVGRPIQRGGGIAGVLGADTLAYQLAPFLAEYFTGEYQPYQIA